TMRYWFPTRLALLLILSQALIGCDVYNEGLLQGKRSGLKHPPPRPPMSMEGEDVAPLTVALRNPLLLQSDSDPDTVDQWREIGLDLDGYDTSEANPKQGCVGVGRNPV